MDIGAIVSWIQAGIWLLAGVWWLVKWWSGGKTLHPLLRKILNSNQALGLLIFVGVSFSVHSLWVQMGWHLGKRTLILNISKSDPHENSVLRIVSTENFNNQQVPLDGYFYKDVTFTNVCMMYNGGPFGMENVTLIDDWKVCSTNEALMNFGSLMAAMDAFKKGHGIVPSENVRFAPR